MRTTSLPTTVEYLYREQERWDHSPAYQRPGGRWTRPQKQRFIDSLLNGFAVPAIYLHDLRDRSGSHYRAAVVDGKQRLETIREFINNDYPLARDFRLLEAADREPSAPRGGERFADFTPAWRTILLSREIVCEEMTFGLEEHAEAIVREAFLRLNAGSRIARAHLDRVERELGEIRRR